MVKISGLSYSHTGYTPYYSYSITTWQRKYATNVPFASICFAYEIAWDSSTPIILLVQTRLSFEDWSGSHGCHPRSMRDSECSKFLGKKWAVSREKRAENNGMVGGCRVPMYSLLVPGFVYLGLEGLWQLLPFDKCYWNVNFPQGQAITSSLTWYWKDIIRRSGTFMGSQLDLPKVATNDHEQGES